MSPQAIHSEVKFKVRQDALLLHEFTISQLVRTTGLNPESVRTEVQRLKQAGFIVSKRRPGQREVLYRLSDDPEKRLALSRSVEAFYPPPPEPSRPTARLYQAALHTLGQAEKEKGRRHEELLAQAAHQLEGAWQAEGASRALEPVQAHLFREQGRLAYLQGKWEKARERFDQAQEKFAAAGLESEARLVDEYLLCVEARRRMSAEIMDVDEQGRCVLETVKGASIGPLARLLASLMTSMLSSEVHVITAVYQGMAVFGERIVSEIHERFERERWSMPPLPLERPGREEQASGPWEFPTPEPPVTDFTGWRQRRGKPDA